jgi:hypothetical protein
MMTVWIMLILWTPPDGVPVVDLSPVVVSQPAFSSEEICEQFRGSFIAGLGKKKAVARCQAVRIKQEPQPVICRPQQMTQEQLTRLLANPGVSDQEKAEVLRLIRERAQMCKEPVH